jgi:hypothetical protein
VHSGSRLQLGARQPLFHVTLNDSVVTARNSYAVSRDGSRFLFSVGQPNPQPITVRLNWTAALHH